MVKAHSAGALQIRNDRDWQERLWTIQRVGWLLMLLFLIAALAGLTGSGGPLATARAGIQGSVIEYPRIARWQAAAEMIVRLSPAVSGQVEVELPTRLVETFGVETVSPTPAEVVATGNGHLFRFDVGADGKDKQLIFHLRAMHADLPASAIVKLNGHPGRLNYVVLP